MMSFFEKLYRAVFGETREKSGPKSMLFHLYNNQARLKGTCAFERIGEVAGEFGQKYYLYAVATTKVDKMDAPKSTRAFGYDETGYRLDCVLDHYDKHRDEALVLLRTGKVFWIDNMTCVIPTVDPIFSTSARATIAETMKRGNSFGSMTPHFIKKSKTRSELR